MPRSPSVPLRDRIGAALVVVRVALARQVPLAGREELIGLRRTPRPHRVHADRRRVLQHRLEDLPRALDAVLPNLAGRQMQLPPAHSALKYAGKPYYHYARQGIEIPRVAREVWIYRLELLAWKTPDATLDVECSKGTYVRTLAEDIGEALGCGAHLTMLRRTGVGALTLEHAVTLDALSDADEASRDAWLQPVDALLSTFPLVRLDETSAKRFLHGQRLPLSALDPIDAAEGERVRVYDATRLLGVARKANGVLAPDRLVVTAA